MENAYAPTGRLAAPKRGSPVYDTCRSIVDFLSTTRRDFNNDLDQILIYIVLIMDLLRAGARGPEACGRGVNAMSVSQITGIPRQTVRRKLCELEKLNLAAQGVDGLWRPTPAAEDLPFSESVRRHFAPRFTQ